MSDQPDWKMQKETIQGPMGNRLFFQSWLPASPGKARLLVVHGLGEHSGRYQNLVDYLLPRGYAVFGLDHPGHGRSEGTPGHINRIEELLLPLRLVIEKLISSDPALPLFLFGHSMGGLLAARLLLDHPPPIRGAILSSPSFSIPESSSALTVALGKLLSGFAPKLPLTSLDISQLSRDPKVVKNYQDDPLVFHGKFSARFAVELLSTIQAVRKRAPEFTLPLLLLGGGEDGIALEKDTRSVVAAISSQDKTLRIYPNLRHELISEPERDRVLADITHWLDERIGVDG